MRISFRVTRTPRTRTPRHFRDYGEYYRSRTYRAALRFYRIAALFEYRARTGEWVTGEELTEHIEFDAM